MKKKQGFTLIEMLVVMGIIAILSGSLMAGFSHITKSAQRSRAQETVSNVASSLTLMLQKKGRWPGDENNALITHHGKDGDGFGTVEIVAKIFKKYGMMGIATDNSGKLVGQDSCGIVDPWAQKALKRIRAVEGNGKDLKVPGGGTVRDHVIYYAVDEDLDGITEATVCGDKIKVRASAIAWCAGANGRLGKGHRGARNKDNEDNVYSWRFDQEVK